MRDLLANLTQALERCQPLVYCSVVETRGSTPQKAGAAMLVFPDGGQSGTLGGGCVEAEVKQRALRLLGEGGGEPGVLTFCLDDNYGWDDGLICGGRMSILADPLTLTSANGRQHHLAGYYARFRDLVEQGKGCTEAVVMADQPAGAAVGSRYLFDADGGLVGQLADGPVPEPVRRHLPPLPKRPRPAVHQGVAYLPILPRITLLLVGGGHVAQA